MRWDSIRFLVHFSPDPAQISMQTETDWVAASVLATMAFFLLSLPAMAAPPADITAGQASYSKCMACHSPEYNRTGPMHCGLVGRLSASVDSYAYSDAMRAANLVWTSETLDRFLAAPLAMVPGTTMGFAGIADAQERRNLIAWLATLNSASDACREVLTEGGGAIDGN